MGSAFTGAQPRDVREDSWPRTGDKFSFRSLDRCGMRSASVNLAGTGSAGSRGGWKGRKVALRTAWSALMLAAFYPGRSLMHPHPHPLPGGGGPCSGWGEVWLLFPCSSSLRGSTCHICFLFPTVLGGWFDDPVLRLRKLRLRTLRCVVPKELLVLTVTDHEGVTHSPHP